MKINESVSEEIDVWHPSVEVEANAYNWEGEPLVIDRQQRLEQAEFAHIDLFSGCGGFSTGFEAARFSTVVALDIHPQSVETHRYNHVRAASILGDIRKVTTGMILDLMPDCDPSSTVVTAGVPCQGFSLSNRKRHAGDKRNYLFREFIRVAREIKPAAVVLENVSGLVSTKSGAFKQDIVDAICGLGYDTHFALLNAAEVGVPQLRKRVVFVGVPKGSRWLFPPATFGTTDSPYRTVGQAILGDLPELGSGAEAIDYCSGPVNEYQKLLRRGNPTLSNHRAPSHPQETVDRIRNTMPGDPMYASFKQRIRLHPDDPSPTQICGGIRPQFQLGHPTQARGLTIRERARIQSFPDSYVFHGGVVQGRVQTGNAVPPLLAQSIADQIQRLLKGERLEGTRSALVAETLF